MAERPVEAAVEDSAMEAAFAEVVAVLNAHEQDAAACDALYAPAPRPHWNPHPSPARV